MNINNTAALYLRISRDDGMDESYSISNQRNYYKKLEKKKDL